MFSAVDHVVADSDGGPGLVANPRLSKLCQTLTLSRSARRSSVVGFAL